MLAGVAFAAPTRAHELTSVQCALCDEFNQPQLPFKIYGNTWYVGTRGLSALLVTGPEGHVLLDGGLPQSAPLIRKNIESLGFRLQDVKLILNSHAHYDHSGGIAALQKLSGAMVAASADSKRQMMAGTNTEDDPQYDPKLAVLVSPPSRVKLVADRETLQVGPLRLTAHLTPGHAPGSTTWTWRSCERGVCRDIVYADSLNPVSTDGFHFTGSASRPDISRTLRDSIARVAGLPCDVIVSVHPGFTDTFGKLAARTPDRNPFVDQAGCKAYAADALRALDRRIDRERTEKAAAAGLKLGTAPGTP